MKHATSGLRRETCAVTDNYKLVVSKADRPWLFDLRKDPDELTNRFQDPSYGDIVRRLTRELARYGAEFEDPYVEIPKIRFDLDAALRP